MKQITVSVDVYAAIWSARLVGENDENSILHRLLNVEVDDNDEAAFAGIGYSDPRHGFSIGEGREISRVYKGRTYRAVARDNAWHMDGVKYDSLNKLSRAVTENVENAWVNWYIEIPGQPRVRLDQLRGEEGSDKSRVAAEATYQNYCIKRYGNGTILVEQEGSYAGKAWPILKVIARKISVSIHNSNGRLRNTRQLGAEVIKALAR